MFKTNRKTGQVFNDKKKRSDKHHGSVKVIHGVRMLELPSGKLVKSEGTRIKGHSKSAELARDIRKEYEEKDVNPEVATYIGKSTSGEIANRKGIHGGRK